MMDESEAKLNFLLSCSFNALPESYIKLRSYLNILSSNIAEQDGLKLPKYLTNKSMSCPFCFTPWKINTNSLKLSPSSGKKFKTGTVPSDIEKEIKCSKNIPQGILHTRNKLILCCKVCTRKTFFSIMRPPKAKKNEIQKEDKTLLKKKKKKKNKYANLNVNACKEAKMKMNSIKRESKKEKQKISNATSFQNKIEVPSQKISSKSVLQVNSSVMSSIKSKPPEVNRNNKLNSEGNKKLVLNPYSNKIQAKHFKSKKKQLALLTRALKEEKKTPSKSSIKDFLKVIST